MGMVGGIDLARACAAAVVKKGVVAMAIAGGEGHRAIGAAALADQMVEAET